MVLYRRNRVPGGTYFFTLTLRNRRLSTLVDRIDDLREAVRYARQKKPFRIDAWVVMPDHIHAVLTLPANTHDYPGRWKLIKGRFTRLLVKAGLPVQKNERGEYDVWQTRYWEHTIRDESDYAHHVDYIHHNPVKHGFVKMVKDWPYSTFHRYVEAGIYLADWAGGDNEWNGAYGE